MAVSLTPEQEKLRDTVLEPLSAAEKFRKPIETQWNTNYSLYRGYSDMAQNTSRQERDRDTSRLLGQREWGADLVIRIIFATIETLLPKMVIHRPRMLIIPRDDTARQNSQNMRSIMDWQQQQIQYDLTLQTSTKDGLIYGIGWEQYWWLKDVLKDQPYLKRPTVDQGSEWVVGTRDEVRFDDPMAEAVDPFDMWWPEHANSLRNCRELTQRKWMTDREVMEKIESGEWCNPDNPHGLPQLSAEDVHSLSGSQKYAEAWQDRKKAEGRQATSSHEGRIHEVHYRYDTTRTREYPRGKITIVLDRQVPVTCGAFPYWHGQLPFGICRPTEDTHRMVGISEPESLEDYQEELSTLRGQRRDAANMVINAPIAYQEGLVDPLDLKWGPNQAIPVNGDPNELIRQLQIRDVPGSAYQEEAAIKQDAEITSGVSDAVRGDNQGAGDTATGAQLIHATANHRIRLKTLRCETEMIARGAYQFGRLNQQKIIENRDVPVPKPPDPEQPGEQVWATKKMGPAELAGSFAYIPLGGSTAPENVPEKLQRGQTLWNSFRDNPHFDQRMLAGYVAELFGIDRPEALLTPPEPGVPPGVLEVLEQIGVPKEDLQLAVQLAQQRQDTMGAQDTGRPPVLNGGGNGVA